MPLRVSNWAGEMFAVPEWSLCLYVCFLREDGVDIRQHFLQQLAPLQRFLCHGSVPEACCHSMVNKARTAVGYICIH